MIQQIHYICNNHRLITKLEKYFRRQQLEFIPYAFEKKEAQCVSHLLIVEPFQLREDYYSIHEIWQVYLSKRRKDKTRQTKILVAGFYDCDCENYLNLLKVPVDFLAWEKSTQDLTQPWCIKNRGFNKNVLEKMEKFFMGHDQVSLFQKLNYWEQSVKNIHYTITGEIRKPYRLALDRIYPMAQRQWQEFQYRWRSYNVFFTCCPFVEERQRIIRVLNEIEPYFTTENPSEELFEETKCLKNLEQIRVELIKMDQYVRPEIHAA